MVKRVMETLVMVSENGTSVVGKVPHLVQRAEIYAFAGISVQSFDFFAKSLIAAIAHVLGSSVLAVSFTDFWIRFFKTVFISNLLLGIPPIAITSSNPSPPNF